MDLRQIIFVLLIGAGVTSCSSPPVKRAPAVETGLGSDIADYSHVSTPRRAAAKPYRDGVSEWFAMPAEEFEASHRRSHGGGRRLRSRPQVEESSFNIFGSPFGGASVPVTGGRDSVAAAHARCAALESTISRYAPGHESCYKKLFYAETKCRTGISISRAQGHNPNAGTGVCTIELSSALRKKRGEECNDVNSVDGEVRCCVFLMRSTRGRYYGPVNRGETPRCG